MVDIQHTALTGSGQLHPPLSKTFTGAVAAYVPDNVDELVVKTDVTPNILYRTTGVLAGNITQIGLIELFEDATPQLAGDLDVNGNSIVSVSNTDIQITPDGTGSVILDGLSWPQADGTSNQVITTDGLGNLSFTSAAGGLANVVEDLTPQLGGNLDVNGQSIISVSAGNIAITPDTTGRVVLDGLNYPDTDGTNGQAITTDGLGNLSFTTVSGSGINNIVEDLTPQLGGDLDINGQSIVSVSAGNITITPDTTGSVVLDGLNWPQSDGTSGQVLQTNGSGQLSFVTPGAASSLNINYEFQYSTITTSGDPGSGGFRLNNTTIASATNLFISQANAAGADLSTIFDNIGSGDKIYLQNNADSTERLLLNITSVTDNGTWYDIALTVDDSNGPGWTNLADFGLIFEHTATAGGGGTANIYIEQLLSSVITSSSQSTVLFSAIDQTYDELFIRVFGSSTGGGTNTQVDVILNTDTTSSNYHRQNWGASNGGANVAEVADSDVLQIAASGGAAFSASTLRFPKYTDTSNFKSVEAVSTIGNATNNLIGGGRVMLWQNTAAITSIELDPEAGNWTDGSIVELYGRKEITVSTP